MEKKFCYDYSDLVNLVERLDIPNRYCVVRILVSNNGFVDEADLDNIKRLCDDGFIAS